MDFGSLRSVNKRVRNLPPDPAVDPAAPALDANTDTDTGLSCPQCGASLSLQAVAKPSAAPPPPEPEQAPPTNEGPGF
jgi:hypothetical protein